MSGVIGRFLKHSGVYAIGNIVNRIGALLLLPLFTNYLTVGQYGQLELLYSTTAVLRVVLGLGLVHTTLRFYYDEKDESLRGRVVTTVLIASLVVSVAAALLAQPFAADMSRWLLDDAALVQSVRLMMMIVVLELSTEICFAYVRVREWSLLFVGLSFVKLLVQVAAGVYFVAVAGQGVVGVMAANMLCVALVWLLLVVIVFYHCGVRFETYRLRPMLRYSLPLAASGLIGVVGANADRFMLKSFVSVEAVGIYGLGMKLVEILRFGIIEPFQRSYGPFRFSIIERPDAKEIQRTVVGLLLAGSGFCAIGLAALTPLIIAYMSPPEYWQASHITAIALIGAIAFGLNYCFETGILLSKRTGRTMIMALIALIVAIGLQASLTLQFGLYGAAIATVGTQVIVAAMTYVVANRLYPLQYMQAPQIRVALLTGAMLAGFAALPEQLHPWTRFAICAVCTVIYGFLIAALDPSVREYLRVGYRRLLIMTGRAQA